MDIDNKKEFSYPIVFCADGKFKNHVVVTAISILENNPDRNFKFYLFCSESDAEWNKKAAYCIDSYGSTFREIEIGEKDFHNFPVMHHFSLANYFRLLIPEVIAEPKFIYLDADIICTGSVRSFLDIDLEEKVLAAVEDPVYKWKETLGMRSTSKYFNSGVILVDSLRWKKLEIGKKVSDFLIQFPEKIRFVDQCALNAILDGEWKRLQPKFNQQAIIYRDDFSALDSDWIGTEIQEAKDEPILVHYTGPSKPWQYNCPHPLKSLYWKYQKKSPFKLKFPIGMKWIDHVKALFPKSLKQKIKNLFVG